jgi:diguanylate cyclase (GGDEF)-like protein
LDSTAAPVLSADRVSWSERGRRARGLAAVARARIDNALLRVASCAIVALVAASLLGNFWPLVWFAGLVVVLLIDRGLHVRLLKACQASRAPEKTWPLIAWTVVQSAYGNSIAALLWSADYVHGETLAVIYILGGLANAAATLRMSTPLAIAGACPTGHVLMYMDLDRFKQVNDNAGHAAGDRLLGEIARVLKRNLRDKDLCARLGGDEFCMLLTDCEMDAAALIAERIRQQVESFRLLWGGRVYSVGASIGVAASDSVGDGQSLLRLADAACYAAKNAGRNSVHVVNASQRISDTSLLRRLGE